jgi:predicted HNH restriction endonuclease
MDTVGTRQRIKIRKPQPQKPAEGKSAEEIVRELKGLAASAPTADYREQSLRIHGLICAKCGREFDQQNRNLLTVHHKDGNHHNNPPDGSNWENLCAYCHEDEHSRGVLGEYLKGEKGKR